MAVSIVICSGWHRLCYWKCLLQGWAVWASHKGTHQEPCKRENNELRYSTGLLGGESEWQWMMCNSACGIMQSNMWQRTPMRQLQWKNVRGRAGLRDFIWAFGRWRRYMVSCPLWLLKWRHITETNDGSSLLISALDNLKSENMQPLALEWNEWMQLTT